MQKQKQNFSLSCLTQKNQQVTFFSISFIIIGLIRNSFGNYVVQRGLEVAEGQDLEILITSIYNRLPEITDKKIRAKWEQIIENSKNNIRPVLRPIEDLPNEDYNESEQKVNHCENPRSKPNSQH